jgi:hypothetical protein
MMTEEQYVGFKKVYRCQKNNGYYYLKAVASYDNNDSYHYCVFDNDNIKSNNTYNAIAYTESTQYEPNKFMADGVKFCNHQYNSSIFALSKV